MKKYFKIGELENTHILSFDVSYSDVKNVKSTEDGSTVIYPKKQGKISISFTVECNASYYETLRNTLNASAELAISFNEPTGTIVTKNMMKNSDVTIKCITMSGNGIYQLSCSLEEV